MLFSEKLKKFRESKKITQEELAALLNVSFQTINRLEGNLNKPHKSTKMRFEKLCFDNNYVFENEEIININVILASQLKLILNSNKKDIENTLPDLLERLIKESNDVCILNNKIYFPKNDLVYTPGVDRKLTARSNNKYVPDGESIWEIGTAKNSVNKIKKDLEKRTKEYSNAEKKKLNFVCITTSSISNKTINKIQAEYKEKGWKKIFIYDLTILENWLSTCPQTANYLLKKFYNKETNYIPYNIAKEKLYSFTEPKTSSSFYLSGRKEKKEKLLEMIHHKQNVINVIGPSRKETYGFVISSIHEENDESIINKTLVCNDIDTLKTIDLLCQNINIIVNFDIPCEYSFANNTHIIILERKNEKICNIDVKLYERESNLLREILRKDMKVSPSETDKIIKKADNNVLIILKNLLNKNSVDRISWYMENKLIELIPILLMGRIDKSNDLDKELLKMYTNEDFDKYYNKLLKWRNEDGTPLFFYKSIIKINSKSELWSYLSDYIDLKIIKKISNKLIEIFHTKNDKYSLDINKRHFSQIYKMNWKYNKFQIENLFDNVILYSIYNSEQNYADHFVKNLLNKINDDNFMFSISEYFPIIAECSPIEFVEYVEKDIKRKDSKINILFEDHKIKNDFFASSNYHYLFYALEKTMLFEETAIKSLDILFYICSLSFEYKNGGQPELIIINKLNIFNNSTILTVEDKLRYIDRVASHFKNIDILLEIIESDSFYYSDDMLKWKPFSIQDTKFYLSDLINYCDRIIDDGIKEKLLEEKQLLKILDLIRMNKITEKSLTKILLYIKEYCSCKEYIDIYIKLLTIKTTVKQKYNSSLYSEFVKVTRCIKPKKSLKLNIIYLTMNDYEDELFNVKEKNYDKRELVILNKKKNIFENTIEAYGIKPTLNLLISRSKNNYVGYDFIDLSKYSKEKKRKICDVLFDSKQYDTLSRIMLSDCKYSKEYIRTLSKEKILNLMPLISRFGNRLVDKQLLKDEKMIEIYYENSYIQNFDNKKEIENFVKYNPTEYLIEVAYKLEYEKWDVDKILDILLNLDSNKINNHLIYAIQKLLSRLDLITESKKLVYVEIKYFNIFNKENMPKGIINYFYKNPNEYFNLYKYYLDNKEKMFEFWYKMNELLRLPPDFYKFENYKLNFINSFLKYSRGNENSTYIKNELGKILSRTKVDYSDEFLPKEIRDVIELCNDKNVNSGVVHGYYNSLGARFVSDGQEDRQEALSFKCKSEKTKKWEPNVSRIYDEISEMLKISSQHDKQVWLEDHKLL